MVWRRQQSIVLALLLVMIAAACGSTATLDSRSQPGLTVEPFDDLPDPTSGPEPSGPGWIRLPDPPLEPRTGSITLAIGEDMFVIGGTGETCPNGQCEPPADAFADGAALNLSSMTWRVLPEAPVGIPWSSATVVDDRIYISPRCALTEGCSRDGRFLTFDTQTWEWQELPSPGDRTFLLATVADRVIASGGASTGKSPWADHAFDAATQTWTALPSDPGPRMFERFVVDLNGELGAFAHKQRLGDVVGSAYNFDTGEWRKLSRPNSAGYQFWMVEGVGYLEPHLEGAAGGIYDPETDSWTPLPPAPDDPSWDPNISGVIGSAGAAFGEYDFGWVVDASTNSWIEIEYRDTAQGSIPGSITDWGPNMFVFGGQSGGGEFTNEAWLWGRSAVDRHGLGVAD